MNTRSLLLTLLGAVVVIAGAEVALRQLEDHLPVLSEWPTLETEIKSAQFEALDPRPTLLIVGSSMTESAVDPRRLMDMGAAPTAYNTAFPFYSPAAVDLWLREFIKPWDDLETILVGLQPSPPPPDSSSDPLTSALLETAAAGSPAESLHEIALWRLRGILVDIDKAARRERATADHLWTELGHQTYYYGRSGGTIASEYSPWRLSTMSDVQERALRRIIETAQQAGVTPIVFLEPRNFPDVIDHGMIADYITRLRDLTDELGVEFWDGYSIDWDESLYADERHFNDKGTMAFTQYIGEKLLELSTR